MNRRVNSILFVLLATVANILLMMVLFVVLLVVFARFLAPSLPPQANQVLLMVLFVIAVVATYVLYHQVMKRLAAKYDLQRYFGPIFGKDRGSSDHPQRPE